MDNCSYYATGFHSSSTRFTALTNDVLRSGWIVFSSFLLQRRVAVTAVVPFVSPTHAGRRGREFKHFKQIVRVQNTFRRAMATWCCAAGVNCLIFICIVHQQNSQPVKSQHLRSSEAFSRYSAAQRQGGKKKKDCSVNTKKNLITMMVETHGVLTYWQVNMQWNIFVLCHLKLITSKLLSTNPWPFVAHQHFLETQPNSKRPKQNEGKYAGQVTTDL